MDERIPGDILMGSEPWAFFFFEVTNSAGFAGGVLNFQTFLLPSLDLIPAQTQSKQTHSSLK